MYRRTTRSLQLFFLAAEKRAVSERVRVVVVVTSSSCAAVVSDLGA
jgi:hypothetical protein